MQGANAIADCLDIAVPDQSDQADTSRLKTVHPGQARRRDEQFPYPAELGFTAKRLPLGGRLGKIVGTDMRRHRLIFLDRQRRTAGSGAPSGEAKRLGLRRLGLRSRRSRRVRYRRRCRGFRTSSSALPGRGGVPVPPGRGRSRKNALLAFP